MLYDTAAADVVRRDLTLFRSGGGSRISVGRHRVRDHRGYYDLKGVKHFVDLNSSAKLTALCNQKEWASAPSPFRSLNAKLQTADKTDVVQIESFKQDHHKCSLLFVRETMTVYRLLLYSSISTSRITLDVQVCLKTIVILEIEAI